MSFWWSKISILSFTLKWFQDILRFSMRQCVRHCKKRKATSFYSGSLLFAADRKQSNLSINYSEFIAWSKLLLCTIDNRNHLFKLYLEMKAIENELIFKGAFTRTFSVFFGIINDSFLNICCELSSNRTFNKKNFHEHHILFNNHLRLPSFTTSTILKI